MLFKIFMVSTLLFSTPTPATSSNNSSENNSSINNIEQEKPPLPSKLHPYQTTMTAHRGGGGMTTPENSIEGVQYAIDIRAPYTEIDVQQTIDGYVVLAHDPTLDRVAGTNDKRKIVDVTFDELKNYNIASYLNTNKNRVPAATLPLLEDVLKLAKGKIIVNVEIKSTGFNEQLTLDTLTLINKYSSINDIVITSTNYKTLQYVREQDPKIRIGIISDRPYDKIKDLDIDFYSLKASSVTLEVIKQAHAQNREVFVWTINSAEKIKLFTLMGVDNIITDYPLYGGHLNSIHR